MDSSASDERRTTDTPPDPGETPAWCADVTTSPVPCSDSVRTPGPTPPPDPVLVGRVRQGDVDAALLLWRRHAAATRTFAQRYVDGQAAGRVAVNAAFARVVREIAADRDPVVPFSLYLRSTLEAEIGVPVDDRSTEHPLLRAFRRVRGSYQTVLWHTVVDPVPTETLAAAVGREPADLPTVLRQAACLLRTEWITETVTDRSVPDTCAWLILRVDAHDAGILGEIGDHRYTRHLHECASCQVRLTDLERLPQLLRDVAEAGASPDVGSGGPVTGDDSPDDTAPGASSSY